MFLAFVKLTLNSSPVMCNPFLLLQLVKERLFLKLFPAPMAFFLIGSFNLLIFLLVVSVKLLSLADAKATRLFAFMISLPSRKHTNLLLILLFNPGFALRSSSKRIMLQLFSSRSLLLKMMKPLLNTCAELLYIFFALSN